jgi:hypothetical protein
MFSLPVSPGLVPFWSIRIRAAGTFRESGYAVVHRQLLWHEFGLQSIIVFQQHWFVGAWLHFGLRGCQHVGITRG